MRSLTMRSSMSRSPSLLRYCARPPFALERLEQLTDDQLVYRFPKPRPTGAPICAAVPWN